MVCTVSIYTNIYTYKRTESKTCLFTHTCFINKYLFAVVSVFTVDPSQAHVFLFVKLSMCWLLCRKPFESSPGSVVPVHPWSHDLPVHHSRHAGRPHHAHPEVHGCLPTGGTAAGTRLPDNSRVNRHKPMSCYCDIAQVVDCKTVSFFVRSQNVALCCLAYGCECENGWWGNHVAGEK